MQQTGYSGTSKARPDTPSPTDLLNAWSRLSRKPCLRQGREAPTQTSPCYAYAPSPTTTTSPYLPSSCTPVSSDPTSFSSPRTHPKLRLSTKTCKRQQTQKKSHDWSARDLPPLHIGQQVHLQEANGTWTPATVAEKRSEPCSYTLCTPNAGLYHHKRRQLQDLTAPLKRITWADHQPRHQPTTLAEPATTDEHASDNTTTATANGQQLHL